MQEAGGQLSLAPSRRHRARSGTAPRTDRAHGDLPLATRLAGEAPCRMKAVGGEAPPADECGGANFGRMT